MSAPKLGHASGSAPVRIALDVLGGDGAPEVVVDAVPLILERSPGVHLVLVGPVDQIRPRLADLGIDLDADPRLSTAASSGAVGMADDPIECLRSRPNVSARVAMECVRDGRADAVVSVGHTGAAVAAATLFLGRSPGATRPPLSVVVPSLTGPLVLLDAGAVTTAVGSRDLLAYAVMGVAYAEALRESAEDAQAPGPGSDPVRVGLLNIGTEAGKGDALRIDAAAKLELGAQALAFSYVGGVEGHDVALGGVADVVVTDGFTGNVLLKGLEGAAAWGAVVYGAAYPDPQPALSVLDGVQTGPFSAGLLLGVAGVVVVGHGAAVAGSVASCVELAERAVRAELVRRTTYRLKSLVDELERVPTRIESDPEALEHSESREPDAVEVLS